MIVTVVVLSVGLAGLVIAVVRSVATGRLCYLVQGAGVACLFIGIILMKGLLLPQTPWLVQAGALFGIVGAGLMWVGLELDQGTPWRGLPRKMARPLIACAVVVGCVIMIVSVWPAASRTLGWPGLFAVAATICYVTTRLTKTRGRYERREK